MTWPNPVVLTGQFANRNYVRHGCATFTNPAYSRRLGRTAHLKLAGLGGSGRVPPPRFGAATWPNPVVLRALWARPAVPGPQGPHGGGQQGPVLPGGRRSSPEDIKRGLIDHDWGLRQHFFEVIAVLAP